MTNSGYKRTTLKLLPDFEFDLQTKGRKNLGEVWAEHDNIVLNVAHPIETGWIEELLYEEGRAIAEDPLLAGRMARQQCRGLEENGVLKDM